VGTTLHHPGDRMAWVVLFIAGLLEIAWAVGLKYTDGRADRGGDRRPQADV